MERTEQIAARGGFRHEDGSVYVGGWNSQGQRHGEGHLIFPDGTRYDGFFENGKFSGIGVINFSDGAIYEGEFYKGWFHGYGTFWRADSMRYEGEFLAGRIDGLGLMTFKDGGHGYPRHEGIFKDCRFISRKNCPEAIDMAQKFAFMSRKRLD